MKDRLRRQDTAGMEQGKRAKAKQPGAAGRRQLAVVSVLLVLIILVFLVYTGENSRRITAQTQSYISDATERTASRLEDFFGDGERHIRVVASLLEAITEENVDAQRIAAIAEESSFLQLRVADGDGHFIDGSGDTGECGETEYFLRGRQGETGVAFLSGAEADSGEAPVVFYAPIRKDGSVVGVVAGSCGEEQVETLLTAKFFGTDARTVLCLDDGSVLAGFGSAIKGTDVLAYFGESGLVSEETLAEISRFFEGEAQSGTCLFSYRTSQGEGNGCLLRLEDYPVAVLQTFPSSVISGMKTEANLAGFSCRAA